MKASLSLDAPFVGGKKGKIGFLMDGLTSLQFSQNYLCKILQ